MTPDRSVAVEAVIVPSTQAGHCGPIIEEVSTPTNNPLLSVRESTSVPFVTAVAIR